MGNVKAVQMNVQCILIWEFMLYNFEMGNNPEEVTKKQLLCKGKVEHNTVSRWFKKYYLD